MSIITDTVIDTSTKIATNADNLINKESAVDKALQKNEIYQSLEKLVNIFGYQLKYEVFLTIIFLAMMFAIYGALIWVRRKTIKALQKKEEELAQKSKKSDDYYKIKGKLESLRIKGIAQRNTILFIAISGTLFIWFGEIKTLLFSISVLLMAFVVLFKEVLTSIIGAVLIAFTKPFEINDRIRIDNIEGMVIDRTLFNTKIIIFENGFNTGNEYSIPNSTFLTTKCTLLSRIKQYNVYYLKIFVKDLNNFKQHEIALDKAAQEELEKTVSKLKAERSKLEKKFLIDAPSLSPFIDWELNEKAYIVLKYACDSRGMPYLTKRIKRRYLELMAEYENAEKAKKEAETDKVEEKDCDDNKILSQNNKGQ